MRLDRKKFLKIAVTGGMSVMLGGAALDAFGWRDRGVKLKPVRKSSLVMGSTVTFEVLAESDRDGYEAIRRAIGCFRDLDRKLSMYDPDSEMGLLARRAGKEPVGLSEDAMNVLNKARQTYRRSGRIFDVTIEPAMRRWGFREGPSSDITPPTDQELKQLEKMIGFDKVELDERSAFLPEPGMAVDLGGIAGGYALDKAVGLMKSMDVAAAFVNFSGDIHCFGTPPGSEGWPVYIYNPTTKQPLAEPVILRDQALSTSGSYQNRRRSHPDRSWGHLILPESLEPAEPVHSLTAIHRTAMNADAWSTAGYLGAEIPKQVETVVI